MSKMNFDRYSKSEVKPDKLIDMEQSTPTFRNAPLVRCVCRLSFEEPIELTISGALRIQTQVAATLPEMADPPFLEALPGIGGVVAGGHGTALAIMLSNPASGVRVAVQSGGLTSSWNKSMAPDGPEYPRYSALATALHDVFQAVANKSGRNGLRAKAVNITYADLLISPGELLNETLKRYFVFPADAAWPDNSGVPRSLDINWRVREIYDVRLQANMAHVPTIAEDASGLDGVLVHWTVGKFLAEGEDYIHALNEVHELLMDTFMKSISKQAVEEWGLVRDA